MRNRSKVLVLAVAASFIVAACATEDSGDRSAEETVVIGASWAEGYETLEEMVESADLTIVGTVRGVHDREMIETHDDDAGEPIPLTLFTVDVEEVLDGPAGDHVFVAQTGGEHTGRDFVVDGDPMLAAGDRAVYFLRQVPNDPDRYFIIAGPTGRVLLDDGVSVLPESTLTDQLPEREEELTSQVQGLVS